MRPALFGLMFACSATATAQDLSLEISAPAEVRARFEGQLVDLPIRIVEDNRPDATEDELLQGETDLCVFVRVGEALHVGLIDRRASRWLVERSELREDRATVTIETAALTARQWVQEVLRGGVLGVNTPTSTDTDTEPETDTDTEPETETEPDTETETEPELHLALGPGWRVSGDGSDDVSHGLSFLFGIGRARWMVTLEAEWALSQDWALQEATIERQGVTLVANAELHHRRNRWTLAGRVRGGVAVRWRETVSTSAGLRAQPRAVFGSAILGAQLGGAFRFTGATQANHGLSVWIWVGADAWLSRPTYEVEGGSSVRPWPIQPNVQLAIRGRFEL